MYLKFLRSQATSIYGHGTKLLALGTVASLSFTLSLESAFACDLCSLYSASRLESQEAGTWTAGISNQYTDFKHSKSAKQNSLKDGQETRSFSTTYLSLAHDITDTVGIQVLLPFIYHDYDKIERYRRDRKSETGIGDAVLVANVTPLQIREAEYTILAGVFGGVKFPTGDTGNLGTPVEEEAEDHSAAYRHHTLATVGNGRALTLGTGSYDFPIGGTLFSRYERFLFLATTQYTLRTEGDFNYRFANDIIWDVGPGYYFSLDHELTIAGRIAVSGEHKPSDKHDGEIVEDSSVSNVYVGPQILVTAFEDLSIEATVEGRVSRDNSDGVLPEWRVRSGLNYRF